MSRTLLLLTLLLATAVHGGHVRCVCSPAECEQLTENDCPAGSGLVWDPCGCCKLCSRLEFEACGGPDGFHGSCAHGLECVVTTASLEGVCRRPASPSEALSRCGDAAHSVTGCDIVDAHCRCHESRVCPGDAHPFSFQGRDECEINLAALLAQQHVSESGSSHDATKGGCQVRDGDEVLKHGETWWSEDRCTECHCKNGHLECQNSHCESCINPHYLPGHCCPVCHDTDIHMPHCTWIDGCNLKCKHGLRRDELGCYHCECLHRDGEACPLQCPGDRYVMDEHGQPLCKCLTPTTNTSHVTTEPPQHPCIDGSVERAHGEEWSDGCRQCACSNGAVLCSLMACPRCPGVSVTVDGECCPRCNGSSSEVAGSGSSACQSADGAVREAGSRWRLEAACAWCECRHGGQVLCGAESACPPAACAAPVAVSGECCPRCMAAPHRPHADAPPCPENRVEGEAWRDAACSSCVCLKGRAVCFEETCQPPACAFPVTVKGRCCPVCINASSSEMAPMLAKTCVDANVTRAPGETWRRDACEHCVCNEAGRVVCTTQQHCKHDTAPAQCCSACAADGAVIGDSHGWQVSTILLTMTLITVVCIGLYCWCRRRGGFRIDAEHAWCCAADKVRNCRRNPTVLTYNPVKLCADTEQPAANAEQRTSFVKV